MQPPIPKYAMSFNKLNNISIKKNAEVYATYKTLFSSKETPNCLKNIQHDIKSLRKELDNARNSDLAPTSLSCISFKSLGDLVIPNPFQNKTLPLDTAAQIEALWEETCITKPSFFGSNRPYKKTLQTAVSLVKPVTGPITYHINNVVGINKTIKTLIAIITIVNSQRNPDGVIITQQQQDALSLEFNRLSGYCSSLMCPIKITFDTSGAKGSKLCKDAVILEINAFLQMLTNSMQPQHETVESYTSHLSLTRIAEVIDSKNLTTWLKLAS